ncbi:hypothetical protein DMA15_03690 [Streptomyces sp. WAC 01529]|uniref:hypothetical protein n=1 Tax=Streptomyces sp. WAC 01529 TaxID=2203205 RepID=UPI000F7130C0|nr:hypothetical protein [Streptomyces sp. WAC 01529]AZM51796.1 hypothetical protein DMA15_03690 [Streptomyces sp. WAC 01529]
MRFEDPPRQRQGTGVDHRVIAEGLKARPGEWAVIAEHARIGTASTAAYRIKRGITAVYQPAGAFEALARTANGKALLYARFVGERRDA